LAGAPEIPHSGERTLSHLVHDGKFSGELECSPLRSDKMFYLQSGKPFNLSKSFIHRNSIPERYYLAIVLIKNETCLKLPSDFPNFYIIDRISTISKIVPLTALHNVTIINYDNEQKEEKCSEESSTFKEGIFARGKIEILSTLSRNWKSQTLISLNELTLRLLNVNRRCKNI